MLLALAVVPQLIVFAYKVPRPWLWVPVFIMLPLASAIGILFGIYNPLHATGWLGAPGLFGGSLLITFVSALALVGSLTTAKWLFRVPT